MLKEDFRKLRQSNICETFLLFHNTLHSLGIYANLEFKNRGEEGIYINLSSQVNFEDDSVVTNRKSTRKSKSKQKRDKLRLEIWNLNKIRLFQEDESGQSSEDSINPKEGKEHESKKEHFGENRRLNETKMADMRDRLQVKVDGAASPITSQTSSHKIEDKVKADTVKADTSKGDKVKADTVKADTVKVDKANVDIVLKSKSKPVDHCNKYI